MKHRAANSRVMEEVGSFKKGCENEKEIVFLTQNPKAV